MWVLYARIWRRGTQHPFSSFMNGGKSVAASAARVHQFPHHCIQVERCRLLARRELLEVFDLLGHDRLHGVNDEGVRDHPVIVGVRVLISPLKRVAAQMEDLWGPQVDEWL